LFYNAGIQIKLLLAILKTTATIAKQVGFRNADKTLNGDELMPWTMQP
jgi:Ca2+-transporting ATPase